MARYAGVQLALVVLGLALVVGLVVTGAPVYALIVVIVVGAVAGVYAYRVMKRREDAGLR